MNEPGIGGIAAIDMLAMGPLNVVELTRLRCACHSFHLSVRKYHDMNDCLPLV